MKLIFDTHAFIWWDSVWEMQIKSQLGKLKLATPLDELVRRQQEVNGVELLPVALDHVLVLQNLCLITAIRSTAS